VAPRALFLRGWTVNALNPKGTVFLLAVMPQFIDAHQPLLAQYLVIGATFGVVEFSVMSGYVALASRLLGLLRSPRQLRWMNRSFGSLFVLAGLFLATFKRAA
jgi:homoserine/homoserine lactone efflux protein